MISQHLHCSVIALALTLGVAPPTVANAQSADRCRSVERKATRIAFHLDRAIRNTARSIEDRFQALNSQVIERDRLLASDDLQACASSAPAAAEWIARWTRNTEDTAAHAQETLDEWCGPIVRSYLNNTLGDIETAIAHDQLRHAKRMVMNARIALHSSYLFAQCRPTAKAVANALSRQIPQLSTKIALPAIASTLSTAYFGARETWEKTTFELGATLEAYASADNDLDDADAKARLRSRVHTCTRQASRARLLGATDSTTIRNPDAYEALTLGDVERVCQSYESQLDGLFARVDARRSAYEMKRAKRWAYLNIYGWGMRKLYSKLGQPEEVSRSGKRVHWRYRDAAGACTAYVFNQRGKLLRTSQARCPRAAAKMRAGL